MHRSLLGAVDQAMTEAQTFVLHYMPIGLDTDQIYESLIGDPVIAQAFASAAQYLPPNHLNRRIHMETVEYGMLSINVRLGPTEKYPVFLMPRTATLMPRENSLSRALALPYRVARDWQMLKFAFTRLESMVDDPAALAILFPWIRPIIAKWADENPTPHRPSKEWRKIINEVKLILSEKPPRNFPRLTEQLNAVCLSGKALFSQYRMLEAISSNPIPSPVILNSPVRGVPDWLVLHLDEVCADWAEELAGITRQERQ